MILVLNAGSSSLKFAVFGEGLVPLARGQIAGIGGAARLEVDGQRTETIDAPDAAAAQVYLENWLGETGFDPASFKGIGHRIVHGGAKFVSPVVVDDRVEEALDALRALAPLHLPYGLGALRRMRRAAPRVAQVACFDTAFHATQPELATRLPIPRDYFDRGYRRYGFHGLSYEHVVASLPKPLPRRILAAHLGSGASMCAIVEGKSLATTMGYSTADGLVMGTRTGSLDPGVIIALIRDEGLDAWGLEDLLYRRSGLLGLSGISSDMKTLLDSAAPEAREAVDHYCYSIMRHAGSLVAAMGGVDALVFTGGIGENSPAIRARVCAHLAWLSIGAVHVVPANEELAIARHVAQVAGEDNTRGHRV